MQDSEWGLWFSHGLDARKTIAPLFQQNRTEEGPVEPNLFPWANGGSTCSIFTSPKGLDDSCHGRIASALPADCVTFAVSKKEHRNFVLYTDHTTVPWHGENTTSTLSHSCRYPPLCVGGYGFLGKREKGQKGLPVKGIVSAWFPSIVISNDHN